MFLCDELCQLFRHLSAELIELSCRDNKSLIYVGSEPSEAEHRITQFGELLCEHSLVGGTVHSFFGDIALSRSGDITANSLYDHRLSLFYDSTEVRGMSLSLKAVQLMYLGYQLMSRDNVVLFANAEHILPFACVIAVGEASA